MSKDHNVTQLPSKASQFLPMNISKCLRSISSDLRLTRWGQIKFMAFTEEILIIAYGKYKKSRYRANDKFEHLFSLCLKECSNQGVAADWDKVNRLATRFNMKPDSPMVLPPSKLQKRAYIASTRTFDAKHEHAAFEANRPKMPAAYRNMKNPYSYEMDLQGKIFDETPTSVVDSKKTNVEPLASTIPKGKT